MTKSFLSGIIFSHGRGLPQGRTCDRTRRGRVYRKSGGRAARHCGWQHRLCRTTGTSSSWRIVFVLLHTHRMPTATTTRRIHRHFGWESCKRRKRLVVGRHGPVVVLCCARPSSPTIAAAAAAALLLLLLLCWHHRIVRLGRLLEWGGRDVGRLPFLLLLPLLHFCRLFLEGWWWGGGGGFFFFLFVVVVGRPRERTRTRRKTTDQPILSLSPFCGRRRRRRRGGGWSGWSW